MSLESTAGSTPLQGADSAFGSRVQVDGRNLRRWINRLKGESRWQIGTGAVGRRSRAVGGYGTRFVVGRGGEAKARAFGLGEQGWLEMMEIEWELRREG